MIYLYSLAGILLALSALSDRQKTKKSLETAAKRFLKILPLLLVTMVFVSIFLYLLPDYVIADYIGSDNIWIGSLLASAIGAISLIPGFITFPLCGMLLKEGVSYTVLAAFTTSLMMVGILTFPLESKYFGTKLAIFRNAASYIIAIIVSIAIGLVYGEVF